MRTGKIGFPLALPLTLGSDRCALARRGRGHNNDDCLQLASGERRYAGAVPLAASTAPAR